MSNINPVGFRYFSLTMARAHGYATISTKSVEIDRSTGAMSQKAQLGTNQTKFTGFVHTSTTEYASPSSNY
jgi:hypothetical protein